MVEEPDVEVFKEKNDYEGDDVIALLEPKVDLTSMIGLISLEFLIDDKQPSQLE